MILKWDRQEMLFRDIKYTKTIPTSTKPDICHRFINFQESLHIYS